MLSVQLSRRNLLAVLAGIVTTIVILYLTGAGWSFLQNHINANRAYTEEIKFAYNQHPYATFVWILNAFSYLSPLIGGFIVGWLTREKGLLYGGILGVILTFLSIGNFLWLVFYVPQFPQEQKDMAQQIILNILLYSPITIMLTATCGYLGERLHKRIRKKKKN